MPELINLLFLFDHFLQFVEVEVGIQQLGQWLHARGVNCAHLWVSGLHMLGVELVPLLQILDEILLPCLPVFEGPVIELASHKFTQLIEVSLAVRHVHICPV
jgi:hypothetical protein